MDELGEITIEVNGMEWNYDDAVVIDLSEEIKVHVEALKSLQETCSKEDIEDFVLSRASHIGDILAEKAAERIRIELGIV